MNKGFVFPVHVNLYNYARLETHTLYRVILEATRKAREEVVFGGP